MSERYSRVPATKQKKKKKKKKKKKEKEFKNVRKQARRREFVSFCRDRNVRVSGLCCSSSIVVEQTSQAQSSGNALVYDLSTLLRGDIFATGRINDGEPLKHSFSFRSSSLIEPSISARLLSFRSPFDNFWGKNFIINVELNRLTLLYI